MNQDLPFLFTYFQSKFKKKKQQNLVILPQILPVLKKKREKEEKSLQHILDIFNY